MPDAPARVSSTSRVTACARRLAGRGGSSRAAASRRPAPSAAPFAACQASIGVRRIGLNSGPRASPASAPKRHRRVGRAEGGGADLRDRPAERVGEHGEAVDVGQLALVGRHAERRVALGMLDAGVALAARRARRPTPSRRSGSRGTPWRAAPRRRACGIIQTGAGGASSATVAAGAAASPGASPSSSAARRPAPCASSRQAAAASAPAAAPAGEHEARPVGAARRPRRVGREMRRAVVPGELAAAVRPEVHGRRPAARHRDGVAGDLLEHRALAVLRRRPRRRSTRRAALDRRRCRGPSRPGCRRARAACGSAPLGAGAGVEHGRAPSSPAAVQRQRGAVGVVVVGDDDRAVARRDTPRAPR